MRAQVRATLAVRADRHPPQVPLTTIAPPDGEPSVRASLVFDNVRTIEALGRETFEQIRAAVPAEVHAAMADATRVAWLPVEIDVAWTEATERVVGRDAMCACMRDGLLRAADGPLLSPVRRSVQAVFGITPAAYLRRAPLVYSIIYRNAGAAEIELGDEGDALIRLVGLPDVIWQSAPYVAGIAGALEAALMLGGASDGRVEMRVIEAEREVHFLCRW